MKRRGMGESFTELLSNFLPLHPALLGINIIISTSFPNSGDLSLGNHDGCRVVANENRLLLRKRRAFFLLLAQENRYQARHENWN